MLLAVCSGWDYWEYQVPGTAILDSVRPFVVICARRGLVGVNGLGVTLSLLTTVNSSQLRSNPANPVRIRRLLTSSDYCLIACGGEAAIVGRGRITLLSPDSD